MTQDSKPLRSVDIDGKKLLMALRNGEPIYGINADSFYWTPDGWVIMELQKCIKFTVREYDLNLCWFHCWRKYAMLWKLTRDCGGTLYIVYYELPYRDFKVHRVVNVDVRKRLTVEDLDVTTFAKLRAWYTRLSTVTASAFPFRAEFKAARSA